MFFKKFNLIDGQEVSRILEERSERKYARARDKTRRIVLKKLKKAACKTMKSGKPYLPLVVSTKLIFNCDDGLPFGEDSFEEILKSHGWELKQEEWEDEKYFVISPMREAA